MFAKATKYLRLDRAEALLVSAGMVVSEAQDALYFIPKCNGMYVTFLDVKQLLMKRKLPVPQIEKFQTPSQRSRQRKW